MPRSPNASLETSASDTPLSKDALALLAGASSTSRGYFNNLGRPRYAASVASFFETQFRDGKLFLEIGTGNCFASMMGRTANS